MLFSNTAISSCNDNKLQLLTAGAIVWSTTMPFTFLRSLSLCILISILLSACVSPDKRTNKPGVMSLPAPKSGTVDSTTAETDTAALVANQLRLRARGAMLEGELLQANRLLNRALRLNPSDAKIYLLLSKVRILEKKLAQAKQFANRGLALSADPNTTKALNTTLDQVQEAIDQEAVGTNLPVES